MMEKKRLMSIIILNPKKQTYMMNEEIKSEEFEMN